MRDECNSDKVFLYQDFLYAKYLWDMKKDCVCTLKKNANWFFVYPIGHE